MAYQVLARKYRPQRFSDVAGQEHVTRTLLNALEQRRTAHGYIFSGHRGIGKTTIARILAMALNCRSEIGAAERPTAEPCGVCLSCQEIRNGNSVDMLEIDAATNRGIDEIRELREAARYSPARDRYKIYLLDEAHQITDAAFNALLKTLEEPPEHVVFMMATTQPEDIPQTIRSRCQHFSFHAVKFDEIVGQLRHIAGLEKIDAGEEALALLAEAGDGSMRDALSILDQAIASAPVVDGKPRLEADQIRELMGTTSGAVFEQLMKSVHQGASAALLKEINALIEAGHSPPQLARQLVRYLRNCLMAKVGGESTELLQISLDERARAARTAALFSEEDLTRFLQIMLRTFDELNYRQEQRFHLELGLVKLVHLERLVPIEQILSGLKEAPGSRGSRSGAPPGQSHPNQSRPDADRPAATGSEASVRLRAETADTLSTLPLNDGDDGGRAPLSQAAEAANGATGEAAGGSAPQAADLDSVRGAIVSALERARRQTAADLLAAGAWSGDAAAIRVEVGMKEKMLGLTINAEAWKIVREALRGAGSAQTISIVPAESVAPGSAAPPLPAGGGLDLGIHTVALNNPLVRQAQEIFRAEVRNVLDLRESSQEGSRKR